MGLAVAVTATSVPTPALAGKTEAPVANEAQMLDSEDAEGSIVATSSDADKADDLEDAKKTTVSKATSSDAEENDGDGDLIDDVTEIIKSQKASVSDVEPEEPAESDLLPIEQTQIQPDAKAEKQLKEDATIDVWDNMSDEDVLSELNEKVWVGEEDENPDSWYYEATEKTAGKETTDWVKITGETLKKKLWISTGDVKYPSLSEALSSGSQSSVKIGIGAEQKTVVSGRNEYTETFIENGEYVSVKVRRNVNVTYVEPSDKADNHGSVNGAKEAKLHKDFTFSINAETGWVPKVSVDGEENDLVGESDGNTYRYTISGETITDDLEITISYERSTETVETIRLNNTDHVVVKYRNEEITGSSLAISATDREISIKAEDGYFLESVNENSDLSENDFSTDGWMKYTIPEGASEVSVKAAEAKFVQNTEPSIIWEEDGKADDNTAKIVLDAIIDWTKTLPNELGEEKLKDTINVEYLMGTGRFTGKESYKALTYSSAADGVTYENAHNFGNSTEKIRITFEGTNRYPKMECIVELTLKPDESNKDVVKISSEDRDAFQITYKGKKVDGEQMLLDKDNHEITISVESGYYLESVDGTAPEESDFVSVNTYKYIVPADATELSVSAKKMKFAGKENPTIEWYAGKDVEADTAEKIIDAVVDWENTVPNETVIKKSDLTVEYAAAEIFGIPQYKPLDYTPIISQNKFGNATSEKIRITWAGTKQYSKMVLEATLQLEDNRQETALVLNSDVKFTYVPDDQEEAFKRAVYDQVISKVDPIAEKPEYEKFEITGVSDYNVGTKNVQVKYLGDDTYKPSTGTVQVEIVKAKSSVRVKQLYSITYGQEIPGEYIVTNPEGLKILGIYAGMNSDFDGNIYFDLPDINIPVLGDLENVIRQLFPEGASIKDVLDILNSDTSGYILKLLNSVGIDTDSFIKALEAINKYMPDSVTSLRVQFGTPSRAGMYVTAAIITDTNYESAVGIGSLIIKPEVKDVRLGWKNNVTTLAFNDRPDTDEDAEELFAAAIYVSDQEQKNPTTTIRYSYKGESLAGVYYDSATPILDPGTYTQTAYIRNGDQLALPIVRRYTVELSDSQIRFDDLDENNTKTVFYNGQPQGLTAHLYYGKDFEQKCEDAELHYTYNGSYDLPTEAGVYEVKAAFNGDGWHKIAPQVTATLIINKVTPQITIMPAEYTYDGQTHDADYQITGVDGNELTDADVTVTYRDVETGRTLKGAPTEVGTYEATVAVRDSKNYGINSQTVKNAVVIKKAKLSATNVEISDLDHVYDGEVHTATVKVTGVAGEEITDYSVTYEDEAGNVVEKPIEAGTYTVKVRVESGNYEGYEAPETKLVIRKATLKGTSVEISDLDHVYDGEVHTATVKVTGVAGEEIADYSVTYEDEAGNVVEKPIEAGTYTVKVRVESGNYEGYEAPETKLVIRKAVLNATSIEASDLTVDYDGQVHEATISAKGLLGEKLSYTVSYKNSNGETVEKPVDAGVYTVLVVVDEKNYERLEQTYTLHINEINPSVIISKVDVVYDGRAHEAEFTITGLDGELTDVTVSYRDQLTGKISENAPVHAGTYDVTVRGKASGNYKAYEFTENGAVVIRQANTSLKVIPFQVTYDGQKHPAYYSVSGPDQGTYSTKVTYNGSEEVPTEAGNYKVTVTVEITGDYASTSVTMEDAVIITKAKPQIRLAKAEYTYDGNVHPASYEVIGVDDEPISLETEVLYNGIKEIPVQTGNYTVSITTKESANYSEATIILEDGIVIKPAKSEGGSETPEQPGAGEGGSETPEQPGTGEGGSETPEQPGAGEGGSETPNKPETGNTGNGSNGSGASNSGTGNTGTGSSSSNGSGSGNSTNSGSSAGSGTNTGSGSSSSSGSGSSRPTTSATTTETLPAGEWKLDAAGNWYYVFTGNTQAGQTYKGWLKDSKDGYWYYLDPATGAMAIGWVQIDGKWYYFNPISEGVSGWTYHSETQKWEYQVTTAMPVGAMYANTTTPDGYLVDANGVCQ